MNELIKNGHVVSPAASLNELTDIYIEDGVIQKIGPNLTSAGARVTDVEGALILPGFIDMACKICDPGDEMVENIESASMAAARGGFTSITTNPNSEPVADNKTVIQYIVSKSKTNSLVHVYPYGSMTLGCEGKILTEIGEMTKVGMIAISDGGQTVQDANVLRKIFKYSTMFQIPVITHCEDLSFRVGAGINEGYVSAALGLRGVPRDAEEIIVARNIVLAGNIGNSLHISHVTTKGSVQLIREAKKKGIPVTCGTCPQYFVLTEDEVNDYNTIAKLSPPLRTEEDIRAIIEGLKDGTIDVIASGHEPVTYESKMREFANASIGISSLETVFPVSYTYLVERGHLDIQTLVEKISLNPAKILGLKRKGCLEAGMDADLVVYDVENPYVISGEALLSKVKFTPFEGYRVRGSNKYTVVGGMLIF